MPNNALKQSFLFEVSWEVCNKVGGIYTVLRSKLKQVEENFQNRYILIGPWLQSNRHFVEDDSPYAQTIKKKLAEININSRVGYWDAEAKPTVILIDFKNRYNIDVLLYNLWSDYGVDSLASNYEYIEPILFSTAAAEVIELLSKNLFPKDLYFIAHFHEWLCGAGLLYLKKHNEDIITIFTTHATVLGRSLASENKLVDNLPKDFNVNLEAKRFGGSVSSKHMLEVTAAKNAVCFTTVSEVTGIEALTILGRYPDKTLLNGLDVLRKQGMVLDEVRDSTRIKLREIAGKVFGKSLPDNAYLFVTSGRYEFHNKGFDVLLKSLAQLEKKLSKDAPPIVVFFLIAANSHSKQDSLLEGNIDLTYDQKTALGIATHKIVNPNADLIIRTANELNLRQPDAKIHIIYSDAYLNGSDGVFDIIYEQILAACDLSIFPSFYEPWGYTPLESIAYGVPTITTDLSGFGYWLNNLDQEHKEAVCVLLRRGRSEADFIASLTDYLELFIRNSADVAHLEWLRQNARHIASLADWKYFYSEYIESYEQALNFNEIYHAKYGVDIENQAITAIHDVEVSFPRFRQFQYECVLPDELCDLRDLAYNFWWSWNENAKFLFSHIDRELWDAVKHNPVHFLNLVSNSALQRAVHNDLYMQMYKNTIEEFQSYSKTEFDIHDICNSAVTNKLLSYNSSDKKPINYIAYFCLEYGIDECLPIYSGGLGILAGDYLKALSNLRIPTVVIGLFYKQGYFFQNINPHGEQVAIYKTWDATQIPMKQVRDENSKFILIGVDLLGRTVYARVWEVKVGNVNLFLLDTDVPENSAEDRDITNSLYGGTRDNRLQQEILLGVGGVRLLLEKLNIKPIIFHLNEGHSAFLLLERIRNYRLQGLTFEEAMELVRSSSIFTTHTPVSAGNETFSEELIRKYFAHYVDSLGISMDRLLALAKDPESQARTFSMTALALRLTLHANAVSKLHSKVARNMWKGIWSNLLEAEIPITSITNGVHVRSWLGSSMRELYNEHLGPNWESKKDYADIWNKVETTEDEKLWLAHQAQKEKLVELVKNLVIHQYSLRNESKQLITASVNSLNSDVLLLGLARRFTGYKRNDLILKDKERLAGILNNEKRPVVLLVSGKAHPADAAGSNLIREFIEVIRESQFNGRIIFLEEYNIGLAKALVQGVDVWINTPILGREACGTSGMKVGINGGLNFSTRDGWWAEAYDPYCGWEIASLLSIEDLEKRNDMENMYLLGTLENDIAALYYDKQDMIYSKNWVKKMKASIVVIAGKYNTIRMAKEYMTDLYCPAIEQTENLLTNNFAPLKAMVAWKQDIIDRFKTVKIKAILINGIKDGKIIGKGNVKIKVMVFSGKLNANELAVELVFTMKTDRAFMDKVTVINLKTLDSEQSGILTFEGECNVEDTGFYSYGIRVFPTSSILLNRYDAGVVYWG